MPFAFYYICPRPQDGTNVPPMGIDFYADGTYAPPGRPNWDGDEEVVERAASGKGEEVPEAQAAGEAQVGQ